MFVRSLTSLSVLLCIGTICLSGCQLLNKDRVLTSSASSNSTITSLTLNTPTIIEDHSEKMTVNPYFDQSIASHQLKTIKSCKSYAKKWGMIYFASNSSQLNPQAIQQLKQLSRFSQKRSSLKLCLEGHTDHRGSHDYNLKLAEQRILAISLALTTQAVKYQNLEIVNYGKKQPITVAKNTAAQAKNRRVVVLYQ